MRWVSGGVTTANSMSRGGEDAVNSVDLTENANLSMPWPSRAPSGSFSHPGSVPT